MGSQPPTHGSPGPQDAGPGDAPAGPQDAGPSEVPAAQPADAESSDGPADPIDAAWAHVEEHWEQDEAHEAFVALCLSLDRLPEAARRYRTVREGDPERAERARQRIDKLLTLATKSLELTRSETPDVDRTRRKVTFFALGLCVFLIGYALWAWLH